MVQKNKIVKVVKIVAIVYLVIGLLLYLTQDYFIFQSKKLPQDYSFSFNELNFTEHNITRADGSNLNYLRFLPTDTSNIKGIVLYYHGNMRNVTRYAPYSNFFIMNNYEVWMMDYPSYGKTTGKLTEQLIYNDATTIYTLANKKVGSDSIIIYGKSIGTGVANYIAATQQSKRVILETPYYNLTSVYQRFVSIYPASWLIKYTFPSNEYMRKIKVPITIFHGTDDGIISYSNAKRLQPLLKPTDEFVTIPNAVHNNIVDFPIYTEKLDSILSL